MVPTFLLYRFNNGMHYLTLDAKTVQRLTKNNNKRVICRINDEVELHSAILQQKEVGHYIMISAAICKKLRIKAGTCVTATFKIDDSDYQFEMPEELGEVLATDPEASAVFHALTKGNQRSLIYLVSQVKSVDKRIERALTIAERIKVGHTSPRTILQR
jgi:uncharacterized protein YdeI (YjbR/CyaY-like superfamily)